MGTDIIGWVEVKHLFAPGRGHWYGVINIRNVVERNSYIFGSLFGVNNFGHFRPLAPQRGMPVDVSEEFTRDVKEWEDAHSFSWITWPEILAINWDEEAEDFDDSIYQYTRQPDGTLLYREKGGRTDKITEDLYPILRTGQPIEIEGTVYILEKMREKTPLPIRKGGLSCSR